MDEKVQSVELDRIKDDVYQQRETIEGEALDALAASIRRLGVVVPLILSPDGDRFVVVAGHRRLSAAILAGLESVPAIIREGSKKQIRELNIAENLFRLDLSPIEQACAINDILRSETMDIPEVGRLMHRSGDWVRRQVALLTWPQDVLDIIHTGCLSVAAASNLAMIDEPEYRAFLIRQAIDNGATARTTAAWLQAWRSMAPPAEAIKAEPLTPGLSVTPMVPQAPCIACSEVYRTDELSHVPVCVHCIKAIREITR